MQTQDRIYQTNVSIPMYTGIPEDVIVNTFHWRFDESEPLEYPTITDYGKLFDRLKTFYDAVYASVTRADYTTGPMTMKVYDLQQPTPHVPALVGTRAFAGTGSGTTTPTEVSICLSIKADYINGVPQARQRGRIFIGGTAVPLTSSTALAFPEITSTKRGQLAAACSALLSGALTDGWTWCILSPTQVKENKPNAFDVVGGWVDNSPDTQRRRSVKATARTTW